MMGGLESITRKITGQRGRERPRKKKRGQYTWWHNKKSATEIKDRDLWRSVTADPCLHDTIDVDD